MMEKKDAFDVLYYTISFLAGKNQGKSLQAEYTWQGEYINGLSGHSRIAARRDLLLEYFWSESSLILFRQRLMQKLPDVFKM